MDEKRQLIDPKNSLLSIKKQCELMSLSESSYYYHGVSIDRSTLELMNLIDEEFTRHPFIGTRRMSEYLKAQGYVVNRKRIQGLYQTMGLSTIYPKKNISQRNKADKIYPYLLKNKAILYCNHVWSCDITYIRLSSGFVYLFAIIDWFSRYVIDWEISNTLEADFCIDALKRSLLNKQPEIFNTDQGSQFTLHRIH